MPKTRLRIAPLLTALALFAFTGLVGAQDWPGSFPYQRAIVLGREAGQPAVIVTEFLTHGQVLPDGRNLAVYEGSRKVPWSVLQVGPGDFCRVALRTIRGGKVYRLYYGGPPPAEKPPAWPEPPGLLLEARRWKPCDLHRLESVQQAFAAAEPLGSDFVSNVSHAYNPFAPAPEPFLSRYRGTLHIDTAGRYRFFTSSQDCSFLLIDGKVVVAAPGAHPPAHQARIKGEVELSAGPHRFEYLHAAAGPDACMLAAWQPPTATKPEVIPARAFAASEILHMSPSAPRHRMHGQQPDFTVSILGEVPLTDSDQPLIRVQLHDASVKGMTSRARIQWDFGDGQVGEGLEPVHVYLRPGLYTVKMTVTSGSQVLQTVNRVQVHRALVLSDGKRRPDELADYVPILNGYDPTRLDPAGVLQLVRACLQAGQHDRAAKVGKSAILDGRVASDDAAAYDLVRLVGPLLRDRLDDPAGAAAVWQAVGKSVGRERWKAECEIEAADIWLNDLLRPKEAGLLLEAAAARLSRAEHPDLARRLNRARGDYHARTGNREAARDAYRRAAGAGSGLSTTEASAWRGAFSRSAEAFLRDGELDRARDELRRWQEQFPADKIEGYLLLLWARYWAARGKFPQAIAAAGDLAVVNPDSPYADRLAFLAAECEEKRGRPDRARAAYHSFLTDHPGSPLVEEAKKKIAKLSQVAPPAAKPPSNP